MMELSRVKYPIGIQDFEKLRSEGYLYVDKTEIIFRLVNNGPYIFLSRPRRFGKSLLLSTIKAYFEGKKELFKGLAIESLEKEWKRYPVLMLGLSRTASTDPTSVQELLDQHFTKWEEEYGIIEKRGNMAARFADIIIKAHETTGERVVVLVDEYDNALINTLHDRELHDRNKELLKSVYSNLKDLDAHIKFGMLTGVSRFTYMSNFSGLNNLRDFTLDDTYGTICGITFDEILKYFQRGITELSEELKLDPDSTLHELRKYYDGYHFSKKCPDIYNPFSLLNAFADKELRSYWMRTGTPTFLVKRLIDESVDLEKLFTAEASENTLSESDASYDSMIALLFQTGYLTIKGYDREWRLYKLGIPNKEVEEGLFEGLMNLIREKGRKEHTSEIREMIISLRKGEVERFMEILRSFMSGIGYPLTGKFSEIYFENNLYVIFKLIGLYTECEVYTSSGRIDMVVKTDRYIYVFEFKLDGSAEETLKQIDEKDYVLPFRTDSRMVYKIGVNFSSEKHNIDSWLINSM